MSWSSIFSGSSARSSMELTFARTSWPILPRIVVAMNSLLCLKAGMPGEFLCLPAPATRTAAESSKPSAQGSPAAEAPEAAGPPAEAAASEHFTAHHPAQDHHAGQHPPNAPEDVSAPVLVFVEIGCGQVIGIVGQVACPARFVECQLGIRTQQCTRFIEEPPSFCEPRPGLASNGAPPSLDEVCGAFVLRFRSPNFEPGRIQDTLRLAFSRLQRCQQFVGAGVRVTGELVGRQQVRRVLRGQLSRFLQLSSNLL